MKTIKKKVKKIALKLTFNSIKFSLETLKLLIFSNFVEKVKKKERMATIGTNKSTWQITLNLKVKFQLNYFNLFLSTLSTLY